MALDPSPQNGRFLSIAVGKNHYIPIGGPIRSFVRGIAPQKVAEQNGVPVYLPFANLPNFARGKLTPPISRTVELIRNKDYQGRKIYRGQFPENVLRGMWYAAEGVLPLSAGEVSQGGRTGDLTRNPLGVAERTAGQLAGQDVRQAGIADRRNQAARSAFGRDWADLTSTEQLEIGPEIAADAGSAQILSRLRTIPEFDGITNDVRNEIYDFHSKVDDYRRQQIDEWGSADESWKDSAQTVAEQAGKEQGFLEWAIALHSEKTKAENRNQEYINFLLDHFDEIEKARQQSDFYGPDYRLPAWLRELRHEKVGAK